MSALHNPKPPSRQGACQDVIHSTPTLTSRTVLLLGTLPFCVTACLAQGLPLAPDDTGADSASGGGGEDMAQGGTEDMSGRPPLACTPLELRCLGDNLLQCNDDGSNYALTPCPLSTRCVEGRCEQATPSCSSTNEPIVLSHQTLFFQPTQDNKSVTSTLTITNCSDAPLTIQKASIQSTQDALDPGSRVFDFSAESAPIQGFRLPPGDTIPIKVEFSARAPYLYEEGTMYLSFLGASAPVVREVALKTNTWCLSIPPLLDLGDLLTDETSFAEIPIHNCGSRALVLSGAEISLQTPDENLREAIALQGTERPLLLAPGQLIPLTIQLTPTTQGTLAGQIDLTFSPRDQERLATQPTSIPFIARTTSVPPLACTDDSAQLSIWLNASPIDAIAPHALDIHQLTLVQAENGKQVATFPPDTVRFESSALFAPRRAPFILSNEKLFNAQALFIPYVAGPHELRASLHEVSEQGDVVCRTTSTNLLVTHHGEYTVELDWYAPDDPVPQDLFPNQGVDLDLYVRYLPEDGGDGAWMDPASSCNTSSNTSPSGRCANDQGYILRQSLTGAQPEAIALYPDQDASSTIEIGVLVNNMASFEAACATVRIWKRGELLVEAPREQFTQELCLGNGLQPSRLLQQNNNFWILGTFNLATQTLDDTQERLLPRGIPR